MATKKTPASITTTTDVGPAKGQPQKRGFKMHQNLLYHVITKQAGSPSKAGLELVMNAIDSGSNRCDVTISPTRVTVSDDGRGFVGMEAIENLFETFGHPHEEGDATYGRFRMGRGQAFTFGRNVWKTNEFVCVVDLKNQESSTGLEYELTIVDKPVKGCHIEIDLYERLLPSKVDEMVRELSKYVKYAQIPVSINGEIVSRAPKDRKWSMETDDAYFDLKDKSELEVFSLGVLVRAFPASQFGAGGTIVSKKVMDLNFARNDILSSCPIYKRICATVRKTAVKDSVKKKRLTGPEWEAVANDVRIGQTELGEVFSTPLVKLVTGSMISLADLGSRIAKHHDRIAVSTPDDHMGDRIMQRGVALVLDRETVDRFGYGSLKELCAGLSKLAAKAADGLKGGRDWQSMYKMQGLATRLAEVKILPNKEFSKFVKADHDDVPVKDLNAAEKFALQIVQRGAFSLGWDIKRMVQVVRNDRPYWGGRVADKFPLSACQRMDSLCGKESLPNPREVRVGSSGSSDAWTDGESIIWINRNNLKLLSEGLPGMTRIAELLFHEYLHQSPNTGNLNVHNMEFYTAHHDLSIDTPIIGRAVSEMMDRAIRMVRHEKRKPSGALRKFEDQIAELTGQVMAPVEKDLPAAEYEPEAELDSEPEALAARAMSR